MQRTGHLGVVSIYIERVWHIISQHKSKQTKVKSFKLFIESTPIIDSIYTYII